MPTARTPEDVSRLIAEAITAKDIDAALTLYEPDATFAIPKAFGEGSVTGVDGLRETFTGFVALSPDLRINAEKTVLAGDIAMVTGNWTFNGTGPDGKDMELNGRFADVIRRQPDGNWLFVIDNPNGHD